MSGAFTVNDFIGKWRAVELKERSAAQEHFLDLCRLLGEPSPAQADPKAEGEAAQLRQQVADRRVERDQIMERSAQTRERAAKAEGEATTLRDALADLSARLDRAKARLAMPWWKWLFG